MWRQFTNQGDPSFISIKGQISILFDELCVGKHKGIKFLILVEDFGTFFVIFCFDHWWVRIDEVGQKVLFVFSFLLLLKEMKIQSQPTPFPYFHFFRNLSLSQKLCKKFSKSTPTKILGTWTSGTSLKTLIQPWYRPKNHRLHP